VLDEPDVSLCFPTDTSGLYYHDDCNIAYNGAEGWHQASPGDIPRFKAQLERCLTPDRDSHELPSRILWLVGDSCAGSVKPAVAFAVRGVYQVRSLAVALVGMLVTDDPMMAHSNMVVSELYPTMLQLLRKHMRADDLFVTACEDQTHACLEPRLSR
jgi:hypothetical protein